MDTQLTEKQWFALGVIACGSCHHQERLGIWVLRVCRGNRDLLAICQVAFGGKIYHQKTRPPVWVLRGKALKVFKANLPPDYPVL